jgi:nucleoside-diphosphate-sugar epimerase
MKKVFVTGATGNVGVPVVKYLLNKGLQIVCLVRQNSSNSHAAKELESLGAELFFGDVVQDTEKYCAKIREECDAVVNFAVIWEEFAGMRAPVKAMLEALSPGNGKKFIFTGGTLGYADSPDLQYEYANSDVQLDGIREFTLTERVILQHPEVVGSSVRLGFTYSHAPQTSGLFPGVFSKISVPEKVALFKGDPNVGWSHVHLDDAAELYYRVLMAPGISVKGQVFNCSDGQAVCNGEVAKAVADYLGISAVKDESVPQWGIARKRAYMNSDKAFRVLGWKVQHKSLLDEIKNGKLLESVLGTSDFSNVVKHYK